MVSYGVLTDFRNDGWVTINGSHVFVGENGNVEKGPSCATKGLSGKTTKAFNQKYREVFEAGDKEGREKLNKEGESAPNPKSDKIESEYRKMYEENSDIAKKYSNIHEIEGDLMECGADVVGQQTNCVGLMGGGVALQIRNNELSDSEYKRYQDLCDTTDPKKLMGEMQVLDRKKGGKIANLFGENVPTGTGKDTDYEALGKAMDSMVDYCKKNGYTAAIPKKLGCGLAGGDWNVVKTMACDKFGKSGVDLKIVSRPKKK